MQDHLRHDDAAMAPAPSGPVARVAALRGWRRLLLAAVAGAAMTAGHVPVALPWTWFLALPVLVWLVDGARSPWQAAAIGWAAGFGYFITGLHWIGHAFLVDAARFAWLLPAAITLMPAGLAIFWGAAFGLARRRWPGAAGGERPWYRVLFLAAWLILAEYLRSKVLTGFPWALPAYVWSETPLMQAAAWIGPHGLSFLTVAVTGLVLTGLMARRRAARFSAVAALGLVAGLWVAGDQRVPHEPAYAQDAPVLRLVQPNAPQHLKWDRSYIPIFYRRLLDGTAAPADPALGPPTAVIWPETAVAFLPADRPAERARISEAAGGVPVLLGALDHAPAGGAPDEGRFTNALLALGPEGGITARYAKHHLVPFGEYLPLEGLLSRLGIEKLTAGGGFRPGDGPAAMEVAGLPRFAALICYEMIFPDEVTPPGPRVSWMLQVTNDAWFGTFAGPQQHLAQARFRAVEQGLPVARAANTGISAMIGPHGRVLGALGLGRSGHLDQRLPAALPATPYSKTGDWPAIALILVLVAASARPRPGQTPEN